MNPDMNPEQPMPTSMTPQTVSQQPVPTAPNIPSDTPMDEFEYTGRKMKFMPGNMFRMIKIGGIILGVIAVLGVVAIIAMKLLASNQVAQVQNTPTPAATTAPTSTPNIVYPSEYDEVLKDSQNYEKAVNSVPDERSRIDLPQIQFGIKLQN